MAMNSLIMCKVSSGATSATETLHGSMDVYVVPKITFKHAAINITIVGSVS